ncbi:MAG: exo-alpha-sialidase [Phycisphaerae bacterium]|nr:exo-alpha-sialidase [Phycisphaerae bacterium]
MNRMQVVMLTSCAVCSLVTPSARADDGARKLLSAQRQVIARSAAWGAIISLSDGSLGVVVQQARPIKEFDCVNVYMEWMRSTDGGKTWSKPIVVAERRGPDGRLFAPRPDGGYVVFQERNQALGQLPSGRIVCAFCELDYHRDKDGKPENRPGKDYAHENQGVAYTWSDDLGKTWVKTRQLPLGPFCAKPDPKHHRGVSPQWRIVTLKDGTALMSLYGSYDPAYKGPIKVPSGTLKLAGVIRSRDNGQTWGDISLILAEPDDQLYEETALCLVGDRLLAHVRTPRHDVVQYASDDGGRTWKGPTPFTEPGQQPGGAFRLAGGKLLGTWGNRRAPFGAAAMLSRDGGKTWDYKHRVSLAWDATCENCGYANGAQAGDGTIVVVYYIMPATQNYRKLWGDSVVYTVRFTEDQFVKAAGTP